MSAFALMLACAALAAWIVAAAAPGRAYIRFACVLYAALAAANVADEGLAGSVALIVSASAPAMLALAAMGAFRRAPSPIVAAIVLVAACVAGMAAAATGIAALAFAPLLASFLVLTAAGLRRWREAPAAAIQTLAAAAAFLAGASATVTEGIGAQPALMLFLATGLLGVALASARDSSAGVEEKRGRDLRDPMPIRRTR